MSDVQPKPKVLRSQVASLSENESRQRNLLRYRDLLEKNGVGLLKVPTDNDVEFSCQSRASKRGGQYVVPDDPDTPLVVIAKKHLKAMLDEMIVQVTDSIPFEIVEDPEPEVKKAVKK